MDYIETEVLQKLYVGTDRGVILTIDILELLELDNLVDDYSINKKVDMDDPRFQDGYQPREFSLEEMSDYERFKETGASGFKSRGNSPGKGPTSELQKLIENQQKILKN